MISLGAEACDLAAKFGADGAGRAGDQNYFVAEFFADVGVFEKDLRAAEEIFDGYIADRR